MYISTSRWRDLEDGHLYKPGDPFPHDGREISEKRIAELTGSQNKAGFAVIKAVPVTIKENLIQKEETPKKAVRSRKKAT